MSHASLAHPYPFRPAFVVLFALAPAILLAWTPGAQGAPPLTVRSIAGNGEPFTVSQLELDRAGSTLRVVGESGPRTIELADVVEIELAVAASGFEADTDVVLADGSRFLGRLLDGVEDALVLETPALGRAVLSLDKVTAVTFGDSATRPDPTRMAANTGEDVAFRRGRSEGDKLTGTIVRAGRDGVATSGDVGDVTLPIAEVSAISIASEPVVPASGDHSVEIDLRDGGFLRGKLLAIRIDTLELETIFAPSLDLALSRIERIRFLGDRFVWLSDLKPASVEQTPYLGSSDDFLFPWRKDRSVTGEALSIANERFGKGIGLHSRTRLAWKLDSKYKSFAASAGISDEVRALGVTGSVVVRVSVDGKVAFESPVLHGGDKAVSIPRIELVGKNELAIEVDFADFGDVGDRALIVEPLLAKG